jgi:hypothetical protein
MAHRQGRLLHVAHHADDGVPGQLRVSDTGAKPDPLTDWILIGKFAFRQRFADHDHPGCIRGVAFVEQAAAPQRNPRGFEIARAHGIAEGAFLGGGMQFELHAVYIEIATQGQLTGERRGCDSAHLVHGFQGPSKKADTSAVIV